MHQAADLGAYFSSDNMPNEISAGVNLNIYVSRRRRRRGTIRTTTVEFRQYHIM